jgi:soluble lytic murein transglycosylase
MKKLVAVLAVLTVFGGAVAYVNATKPGWYVRLWYPLRYESIVRGHAGHYRLDPALLAAVIYQESKFNSDVRSSSGAIGLRVQDLYNPEINIRYGAWYLRHLLDKYGDERTALAAYNAGQENVDRWRAAHSGIVFGETRHYVSRVEELKKLYRRGYPSELRVS